MCIQFMKETKAKTLLINSGQCFVRQDRLQIVSRFLWTICCRFNRPWWPSSLSHHVSNSSRNRRLGPRFKCGSGLGYWSLRIIFLDFKYLCHGWVRTGPLACLVLSSIWNWRRFRVFGLEYWSYSIVYYQFNECEGKS